MLIKTPKHLVELTEKHKLLNAKECEKYLILTWLQKVGLSASPCFRESVKAPWSNKVILKVFTMLRVDAT